MAHSVGVILFVFKSVIEGVSIKILTGFLLFLAILTWKDRSGFPKKLSYLWGLLAIGLCALQISSFSGILFER
jgi:hypothetical protein